MPPKSKQQAKFLYSQHPEVVKKWHNEGVSMKWKKLPKRVKGSKSTPAKTIKASQKYAQPKKTVQSKRRKKKGGK